MSKEHLTPEGTLYDRSAARGPDSLSNKTKFLFQKSSRHLVFYWTVPSLLIMSGLFRAAQNMAQTSFALVGKDLVHLGSGTIGAFGALLGLTTMISTTAVGTKVSTHHSPLVVVAGAFLLTTSLLTFALAPSTLAFVFAVATLGIAGGLAMPSLATSIGHFAGSDRDRALAVYTVVLSISLALGPLGETAILTLSHENLLIPFAAFSALPLLGVAIRLRRREKISQSPLKPGPESNLEYKSEVITQTTGLGSGGSDKRLSVARANFQKRTGYVFSSRPGQLAITVQLLYSVPFAAVTVFGALVARSVYGLSPAQAQVAFTVFFATSMVSRAIIAWRSPVTNKFPILAVSALLTFAGLVILTTGSHEWVLLLAMALLGIPHGVTFPLALALVAQSSEAGVLAGANAALFTMSNLAAVIAPGILGWLGQSFGYRAMLGFVILPVIFFSALMFKQRGIPNGQIPNGSSK